MWLAGMESVAYGVPFGGQHPENVLKSFYGVVDLYTPFPLRKHRLV